MIFSYMNNEFICFMNSYMNSGVPTFQMCEVPVTTADMTNLCLSIHQNHSGFTAPVCHQGQRSPGGGLVLRRNESNSWSHQPLRPCATGCAGPASDLG